MGDNTISIGTAILSGFGGAVASCATTLIVSAINHSVLKKENKAAKAEIHQLKTRLAELINNSLEKQKLEMAKPKFSHSKKKSNS
jgi:hypothetical protein